MKLKKLSALIGTAFLMTACVQNPGDHYTLKADIEGLPDGAHVQLIPVSHDNEKPIADTVVTNGHFVFKGVADEPLAVLLKVEDAYGSKSLMLENKDIKMIGSVTSEDANGIPLYDFSSVVVSGSPLTENYVKLLSVRNPLDSIYQANNETFKNIREAYAKARATNNQVLMDSVKATDTYKASVTADSVFFAMVESVYYQTVMDNKDTYWGPLMMISLFSYLTEEQKPWYDELSEEAKESRYGKMVKEEVVPVASIGSVVPAFTVKDREEKASSLAELCKGNKYILIDFWASWCNPCRKEIPNLKKQYAQYGSKGFQIISISIDKKEEEWLKALEEEKLPWPNFLDTEGIADDYKVKMIPTMYLIDAQGVVIAENLRGEELGDKLAELLGARQ